MTDQQLIAIARRVAAERGYPSQLDAVIVTRSPRARILLSDPAYARGGGILVVVDPSSEDVVEVIPQL
jgi:hypothetical protein